jgi:hypothetical protein
MLASYAQVRLRKAVSMESLHDVVRMLVRAGHQHGQIGEAAATEALAVVDGDDPQVQEERDKPRDLSDQEQRDLEELQARREAAQAYADRDKPKSEPEPAPAPSLASVPAPPAPAPTATSGLDQAEREELNRLRNQAAGAPADAPALPVFAQPPAAPESGSDGR